MAPHSSTLAWKIPWMEEPGGLQSMGSLRVRHDWATSLVLFTFMHWRRKWQPTPVFLPGESQGQGSLVGCCSDPFTFFDWFLSLRLHEWRELVMYAGWDRNHLLCIPQVFSPGFCFFLSFNFMFSFHVTLISLSSVAPALETLHWCCAHLRVTLVNCSYVWPWNH